MHSAPFAEFDDIVQQRRDEADQFYATLSTQVISEDAKRIQRQAFAGLLWTKQAYFYEVAVWLDGDPAQPPPPTAAEARP